LNPANTAHRGVIRRLESAGLQEVVAGFLPSETIDKAKGPSKDLQSPFEGAQDKDKDKDKDIDKDKDKGMDSIDLKIIVQKKKAYKI